MSVQSILHAIDGISTWVGKAAAWLIIALMTVVCVEVFKRYILNAPTAWIFDLDNMLYGTLFMLAGAYGLAEQHFRRAKDALLGGEQLDGQGPMPGLRSKPAHLPSTLPRAGMKDWGNAQTTV